MKTKDSISKKKQKLAQELSFWKARERQLCADAALFGEPNPQGIEFCRQEAAKRQEELDRLQTRTRRQVFAGWR